MVQGSLAGDAVRGKEGGHDVEDGNLLADHTSFPRSQRHHVGADFDYIKEQEKN